MMIIECINCHKKFEVESNLIPISGREIKCGLCNHVWYYKKIVNNDTQSVELYQNDQGNNKLKVENYDQSQSSVEITVSEKDDKYSEKSSNKSFKFSKILSYLLVIIITFITAVILVDTIKLPLINIFPDLEFLLFNLFETLKDIYLFFENLIR